MPVSGNTIGVAPYAALQTQWFVTPSYSETDVSGAGLGLTIAKTFVEAHGQRIWVEDTPGGGARFCFTLPVAANIAEERELVEDSHHR